MKLSEFGFTINQAKIYLSIVESGLISVGEISKNTQLYVQDIYKILPKLEKMGLITKTIDKPVLIKAIPVEKALNRLVTVEKSEANQRISRLEANLKEITSEIIQHQNTVVKLVDDTLFIPLTTDEQIKNRADETFEKANVECDLVLNLDLIINLTRGLRENFELLRKVKTRIIIETVEKKSRVKKIIEKTLPKSNDFQIKIIHKANLYLITSLMIVSFGLV